MPVTLLMGAMVSIQCGAALAKGLFPLVGAVGTATMRIILAAAILALILRPWEKAASIRANIRSVILYGLCLGLMNISFYAAIDRIPLGVAVALEFTGPLGVAILSSRRPVDLIWVALATLGIVALARAPSSGESLDLYGVVLALLAGLFWGLYIISGERASREHGQQAVAIGMIVAALVALPIAAVQILDEVNTPFTKVWKKVDQGADDVPRFVRAIIDDEIEVFRNAENLIAGGGDTGITDGDRDPGIAEFDICAGRIDVAADDGLRLLEILGPQLQRAAILYADFQHIAHSLPQRPKNLLIDIQIE